LVARAKSSQANRDEIHDWSCRDPTKLVSEVPFAEKTCGILRKAAALPLEVDQDRVVRFGGLRWGLRCERASHRTPRGPRDRSRKSVRQIITRNTEAIEHAFDDAVAAREVKVERAGRARI